MTDDPPQCPECGAATRQFYVRVGIEGVASTGMSPEQMPKSWRGTRNGDAATVDGLRNLAIKRQKLEAKYPEIAGDRRPVLAHEGIFENKPLRAGDNIPQAVSEAIAAAKPKGEKQ